MRVWEQDLWYTPSGNRLSDLDSDSDGDCEVPSSCIEELELQIPEPVLTTAHFVDLEEHQFRLQEIEVLVSVFHLPSWIFIDVSFQDEIFLAEVDDFRRKFRSSPLYQAYMSWKSAQDTPSSKWDENTEEESTQQVNWP